jgi:hypothetical protein
MELSWLSNEPKSLKRQAVILGEQNHLIVLTTRSLLIPDCQRKTIFSDNISPPTRHFQID